jgi:hypothetical protein
LKATGVTKDEQKRALLLHVAGEEVQDIIETLDNTGTKYDQVTTSNRENTYRLKDMYFVTQSKGKTRQ